MSMRQEMGDNPPAPPPSPEHHHRPPPTVNSEHLERLSRAIEDLYGGRDKVPSGHFLG